MEKLAQTILVCILVVLPMGYVQGMITDAGPCTCPTMEPIRRTATRSCEGRFICACSNCTETCTRKCIDPCLLCNCVADCPEGDDENFCNRKKGCSARWTKVYEHAANGTRVSGDKAELIDAVHAGADVRVYSNGNYVTSVQNLSPTSDGELCAQALFHVSKNGYDQFQDNAYWWFVNLCTTGSWHMTRYNVGEHVTRGTDEANYAIMSWFVRGKCNADPALQVSTSGNVTSGSVSAVITAVISGADVRIKLTPGGYTFPADNLQIDSGMSLVAAQALWHVSQKLATDHYIFQNNAYWWFTITSTDGEQDISRWSVGEHDDRGNTTRHVASSWFVDACWKQIYRHDQNGNALSGSFAALRAAVEAGHKVKIVYNGYSLQADHVWVRYDQVYAMLLNSLSKDGIKYFQSSVYWYWQIASTSGVIGTTRYLVGDPTYVPGTTTAQNEITWFVDDREWSPALSVSEAGSVVSGSKAVLENAVRNGAEVRYRLTFSSIPNYSTIQGADNLAISADGNIGATHIRSVSASFSGTQLNFQTNPYWWVTTTGRLEMSRWTVGDHVDRGRTHSQVGVEFFISE